jgi:helicase
MRLTELDLPGQFLDMFEGNDLDLYPHQEEAIKHLESGKNVVVSVPTASGKSLIAYVAIYREFLKGRKSMYIVPLRALASEKYEDLKRMSSLGLKVAISVGDYDDSPEFIKRFDVIVCTSEKADSLFHHDPSIMFEISLIVADELHLIGDEGRGARLETFLSAARYMNPDTRILGLSATISNIEDVSGWLEAETVISDFRPVTLQKGIMFNRTLEFEEGESLSFKGRDDLARLCEHFIIQGGQLLIFVNSRKRSEDLARKLSYSLEEGIVGEFQWEPPWGGETDRYQGILTELIPKGVSFHHAGLSSSQRTVVEALFREGKIKVLVATPTLAAGVNLPARVVVIRDITRFSDGYVGYISNTEVHQMLGRAGRPKYDKVGFGIIYAASETSMEKAWEYLDGEPEPVFSSIGKESLIRFNTLALVSTGLARNIEDLVKFHGKTLLGYQTDVSLHRNRFEQALSFLDENDFIRGSEEEYKVTKLGKTVSDLYIDPVSALILKKYLDEGNINDQRTLYNICRTPEVPSLIAKKDDTEDILFFMDENGLDYGESSDSFNNAKTAMVLYDWINERSTDYITGRYGIGPGDIQAKVSSAEWMAYSLSRLASMLLPERRTYFEMLAIRIREGIREDIWELTAIPNIGRVRARRLYAAGLTSLDAVAGSAEGDITKIAGFSHKLASETIGHARTVLQRRRR